MRLTTFSRIGLAAALAAAAGFAANTWQKEDPSQWSGEDVYQILNNSPWSKSVTAVTTPGYGQNGGGGTWGEGMPGGGMGRMGGGVGGMGGGMGRGRRGQQRQQQQQGPTVTVQWASALPVRLAQSKLDRNGAAPTDAKPMNEYVIAVIGFPKTGFVPRNGSSDPNGPIDDAELADHLKTITVLSLGGQRLNPTKVELNQGRDARAVFHFDRLESINAKSKDAEFRITSDHMELKKKFPLKEMEFQGKLEL